MKKNKGSILLIILYIFVLELLFPQPTHAYIDPGSGSYIFQLLIAGFLGLSVGVKMFWKQISSSIKSILSRQNDKNGKK